MKRSRFTDEQIIGILSEEEPGANAAGSTGGRLGSAGWRRRLRLLEDENAKPKKLPAYAMFCGAAPEANTNGRTEQIRAS